MLALMLGPTIRRLPRKRKEDDKVRTPVLVARCFEFLWLARRSGKGREGKEEVTGLVLVLAMQRSGSRSTEQRRGKSRREIDSKAVGQSKSGG
jgi:hypothetical protein